MKPSTMDSLNPIDHPAFSPSWPSTATTAPITASRVADETSVTGASSLLKHSQHDITTLTQGVQPTNEMSTNVFTTPASSPTSTATTAPTHDQHAKLKLGADLPQLPGWIAGMLTGIFSFLFVVAFMLLLAQIWPSFDFFGRANRRRYRTGEYARIEREEDSDEENEGGGDGAMSSTTGVRRSAVDGADTAEGRKQLRQRRPTLSIDTSGVYYGLGIAVHGESSAVKTKHVRKRVSYDADALRVKSGKEKGAAFTAPLPATRTIDEAGCGSAVAVEVESGLLSGCADEDGEGRTTSSSRAVSSAPAHHSAGMSSKGSAVLEKLNAGVYFVADRLSRTFYDAVEEPEEGLLLPVHNEERETALVAGGFVS
ncbi:hypothetical protein BDY17DRAFT_151045 [Neohortaea acidophila]|uniref:Transmembrane protein n=1 Tax=Neohortaea acidophila TaxID=245834 RepID=A0A6A6PV08_9PEZI|nr:uncharacterized protein BDY17DRAFT_151045 [Neohortaea acidophila]KAF2483606.1 hypothetical protein BDY17DRAFT_151045 [Neohortaea acidophila]